MSDDGAGCDVFREDVFSGCEGNDQEGEAVNMDRQLRAMLESCYEAMEGSDEANRYSELHGIDSLAILTVYDDETASLVASHLERRVRHKTVIEIGGGFGLLAMHLSEYAKHIYVVEANPVWTSVYVAFLHRHKPPNVTFIFGSAEELAGRVKGDLAIFCTHSDASGMREAGLMLAPECIDVYGEILESMAAPDSSLIFETMCEMRKGATA